MDEPKFGEVWRDGLDGETIFIINATGNPVGYKAQCVILVERHNHPPLQRPRPVTRSMDGPGQRPALKASQQWERLDV